MSESRTPTQLSPKSHIVTVCNIGSLANKYLLPQMTSLPIPRVPWDRGMSNNSSGFRVLTLWTNIFGIKSNIFVTDNTECSTPRLSDFCFFLHYNGKHTDLAVLHSILFPALPFIPSVCWALDFFKCRMKGLSWILLSSPLICSVLLQMSLLWVQSPLRTFIFIFILCSELSFESLSPLFSLSFSDTHTLEYQWIKYNFCEWRTHFTWHKMLFGKWKKTPWAMQGFFKKAASGQISWCQRKQIKQPLIGLIYSLFT